MIAHHMSTDKTNEGGHLSSIPPYELVLLLIKPLTAAEMTAVRLVLRNVTLTGTGSFRILTLLLIPPTIISSTKKTKMEHVSIKKFVLN